MTLTQFGDILLTTEIKIIAFLGGSLALYCIHWLLQLIITIGVEKKKKLSLDIVNFIRILVRIGGLIAELFLIIYLFNLPMEQIFGLSAFLGAIISFGSTKAISNFFTLVSSSFID